MSFWLHEYVFFKATWPVDGKIAIECISEPVSVPGFPVSIAQKTLVEKVLFSQQSPIHKEYVQ
jgi:hypothetical protein